MPGRVPNAFTASVRFFSPSSALNIMTIGQLLTATAKTFPGRIAATYNGQNISYSQLDARSNQLAASLLELGFVAGTRGAILCDNSLEYLTHFFGLLKAGLVVVPLDTSLPPADLAAIINDCQAELLCTQLKWRRKLPLLIDGSPSLRLLVADFSLERPDITTLLLDECAHGEHDGSVSLIPQQNSTGLLAAIFYTSGSTGASKGVMLSHRNLISNTLATVEYLRLTADDSVLVVLPFYYIYGNSLLLTHVAVGGRLVIDNQFLYPEAILDSMAREEVTGFSGVPSNFQILLGKSTFASRTFPKLRYLTQAGGAMAVDTIRRLIAACPDKQIYVMYGQTEASPRLTYLPPEQLSEKIGSVGIPVPGVEVLILDANGQELPMGVTGEVVVAGDNVMLGYWNQPDENANVLKNGRLHTGDLGKKDADGFLYIVGRKKEIIKCGGNRVSVKEVEDCLLSCPRILEATVFGVEDPILVEAVKAVVVLKPGEQADARDVMLYCREHLADYKVPKYIQFTDALPKYQTGKVNKSLLKKEHTGQELSK